MGNPSERASFVGERLKSARTLTASATIMSTSSPEQRSWVQKPVEAFVTETHPDEEGGELSRSIGLFQLTMFGVGATIGTGIHRTDRSGA